MTKRNEFKEILRSNCKERFNVDKFLDWLESNTDFFTAPASTKYHLAKKEGLLEHSLNVYHTLKNLCELYDESIPQDSIAICGLLHDICKINFYKQKFVWIKNSGNWEQRNQYVIEDEFPIGHGEKSVIILLQHFSLKESEMLAIRWHMNGFDTAVKGGEIAYNNAIPKYKLVTLLEVADLISSRILEGEFENGEKRN